MSLDDLVQFSLFFIDLQTPKTNSEKCSVWRHETIILSIIIENLISVTKKSSDRIVCWSSLSTEEDIQARVTDQLDILSS